MDGTRENSYTASIRPLSHSRERGSFSSDVEGDAGDDDSPGAEGPDSEHSCGYSSFVSATSGAFSTGSEKGAVFGRSFAGDVNLQEGLVAEQSMCEFSQSYEPDGQMGSSSSFCGSTAPAPHDPAFHPTQPALFHTANSIPQGGNHKAAIKQQHSAQLLISPDF